jgi:hypothetical protein
MDVYRVRLDKNTKDWLVMANRRIAKRIETKQEAIDIAESLADKFGGEVLIYSREGQLHREAFPLSRAKRNRIRDAIREVYNLPTKKNGYRVNGDAVSVQNGHSKNGSVNGVLSRTKKQAVHIGTRKKA